MTTNLFAHSFTSHSAGNQGKSLRSSVGGLSGPSQGEVLFTFQAGSIANWKTTHISVAVQGTATLPAVQTAPTEIKFGGASGFNITENASLQSDPLTFAFLQSDTLVFTFDDDTAADGDGGDVAFNASVSGSSSWSGTPPRYGQTNQSGFTLIAAGDLLGVSRIDTQPGPWCVQASASASAVVVDAISGRC